MDRKGQHREQGHGQAFPGGDGSYFEDNFADDDDADDDDDRDADEQDGDDDPCLDITHTLACLASRS